MTGLLERLLGRLPLGWLQLAHHRGRLASAIAGVAFANLLVFFQLGFLGALGTSVVLPYEALRADLLLSAPDARTLAARQTIPARSAQDALSTPEVVAATPLYVGTLPMRVDGGRELTMRVFGIDPASVIAFWRSDIAVAAAPVERADTALIDTGARLVDPAVLERVGGVDRPSFEVGQRTVTIAGRFRIGAGFETDGNLIVSDQTFLGLFPERVAGAPNHVLVRLAPGADPARAADALRSRLDVGAPAVRSIGRAAEAERRFQTVERPIGVIFGFGAVMGLVVGVVIVYQVLSSDVADHLREYATLRAIGYRFRFFLGVIVEEALILAVAGFVPGSLVATGLYALLGGATGLALAMTPMRLAGVLVGTLLACIASGALAARKLSAADPAELF